MFESLRENIRAVADSVHDKYTGFTDSVDKFNQDLADLLDVFVSVRDLIGSVFSFIGQETAILLFCTFVFLFVVNLIPFLFFDKKIRYFIGIGFGIFLSFSFGYTAWALAKYLLIMFSPMILEFLLVWIFKTTGKTVWISVKKGLGSMVGLIKKLLVRLLPEKVKTPETEKSVQKESKKI